MEDLPFWLSLAQQNPGPILELGCGTGRVLLPLAQAGFDVFGLDLNLDMLRFLSQQASLADRKSVHLVQADMSDFHLEQLFGLIFLPCNTMSTLPQAVFESMLSCAYHHLRPGGIFVASMPNPATFARLQRQGDPEIEEVFAHPDDDEPVQVSSSWQKDNDSIKITWTYDHLLPDGRVERLEMCTEHNLYPASFYVERFTACGFGSIEQYGDYNLAPYRKNSPLLILIARSSGETSTYRL